MNAKLIILAAAGILLIGTLAPQAIAAAGTGEDSCAINCLLGGGCSASGPGPCTCRCTGFLGLGGAQCVCGSMSMDNPPSG